jgi:hypothetical protein
MAILNYEDARKRFYEIREEIMKLQIEAEQIILAHQDQANPEGYGKCDHFDWCKCDKYHNSETPAVCGTFRDGYQCKHYASEHAF